jgi:N-acetylglucosamine-6-phosphate deacetylase
MTTANVVYLYNVFNGNLNIQAMKFCNDDAMRIVDVHTHGLGGFDTLTENPDDMLKIAELHGNQGVTDIVPTIYPGPVEIMRKNMTAVKEAIQKQRSTVSGRPSEATNVKSEIHSSKFSRIIGIHLEGPFLNPNKAGALDAASFLKPSEKTWKRLIEGFEDTVRIVTIAPELEGAKNLIKAISNRGIIVSLGHSEATYEETKNAFQAGAKGITHLFNAMRAFHHREPGIAGFGLMDENIYLEVIADPFHLSNETLEFIFEVKNPEKIIIISDSIKGTGIATKHNALLDNIGTLQGGSLTIIESAKRLISLGFDKDKIMACISANAWSYLLTEK